MQELGFTVPAGTVTTVQQLMAVLQDKLHVHAVETIAASECFCCTSVGRGWGRGNERPLPCC